MKRYLIILAICLCCLQSEARMTSVYVGQTVPAAAGQTNIIVDFWQTFETDTVNETNLRLTDNYSASTVGYSLSGSAPVTSTSGEQATLSTVNSTADTGTRGLSLDCNNSQSITMDMNTYPTSVSVGFWIKTPTLSSNTFASFNHLGEGINANAIAVARLENNAGTYTMVLRVSDTTNSSTISVSAGTWYWVTVLYVKNGTTKMSVYNLTGSQVGSEVTVSGLNKSTYYHGIECISNSTGTMYIDDYVIDLDGSTYPLGP